MTHQAAIGPARREKAISASKAKSESTRPSKAKETAESSPQPSTLTGWQGRVVDRSLERATRRSLDRAKALIDAAMELLREGEHEGFTVQEVADRAGQSLRTFYQHFGSKNELLLAVFEEELRRHARTLENAVDRYTDPIERLAAFLVAGATGRANPHEEIALAQYRIDLAVHRPEDLATVQTPVIRLVKQLVQDAMDAGALVPGDADPAVFLLLTLKSARLHADILGNELGVRLPDAMALARFCIEGLGGKFPVGFPKA